MSAEGAVIRYQVEVESGNIDPLEIFRNPKPEDFTGDVFLLEAYLFISHNLAVVKYVSDHVAVMYAGKLVETAETEALFMEPKHPYTEALLSAAPNADPSTRNRPRIVLTGEAADAGNLPSGCAFHPRCPYARERCQQEAPALAPVADAGEPARRAVQYLLDSQSDEGGWKYRPRYMSDVSVTGCDTVSAATSNYTVNMNWSGAATTSIRLRAYIVTVDADEEPLAIVANGTITAFEISAGDADVTDITVTSSSSQAVIGSNVTVPFGYSLSLRQLIATHSDVASISLGNLAGSALTRDVIAPFFVGADYTIAVAATANAPGSNSMTIAWATGLAPGDFVPLELARPPVQLSPPEAATGVTTGTEFAVSNPDGGVTTFYGTASGGGSVFFITTDAHTVTIPDLASIGLPLPAATDYIWTVLTSHDVPTVNDAVTGAGYIGEYLHVVATSTGGAPGPTVNGRISTAETRSFTTQ